MIIDTHSHLTDLKFKEITVGKVVENAKENGILKIITVGTGIEDNKKALEISKLHQNIYAAIGLYPNDTELESHIKDKEKLEILESMIDKNVVAIGECGLDYADSPPWEIKRSRKDQFILFEKQIDIACKNRLPIIIHSREAIPDTLDILKTSCKYKGFKAVWHCYTEDTLTLKALLDMGIFVSFTGIITYPSAVNLQEVVRYVPINNFMIETDSPYLPPQKARKNNIKINEPAYAKMVAEEISAIKNLEYDEICRITTETAEKFFKI